MKLLEKVLGVIIVIALIMKFAFIVGSNVLIVMAISLLSVIYYPMGFAFFNGIRLRDILKKASYKGLSTWRILGAIGAGMALSNLLVGILFSIMHYPGAGFMLYSSIFIAAIILGIVSVKYLKTKSEFYKRILIRIAIIGGIALLLALIPSMAITKLQYRNYPAYIEARQYWIDHPNDEEAYKRQIIEYNRVILPPQEFELYMQENYPDIDTNKTYGTE